MQNTRPGNSSEHSKEELRISEILRAMNNPAYPEFIQKAVQQVQWWMAAALEGEDFPEDEFSSGDRRLGMEPEHFFAQMEWILSQADLVPSLHPPGGKEDAVVVAMAPMDVEEGLRLAIDHVAVFAPKMCRQIWIISDTWNLEESFRYKPHVQALKRRGVTFRYLLVTPWGWTEIPFFARESGKRNVRWFGQEEGDVPNAGESSGFLPGKNGEKGREDRGK